MRDPQRFPVRIRMLGYEIGEASHDTRRMLNGQADVIVYTGDNWLMNNLGKAFVPARAFSQTNKRQKA